MSAAAASGRAAQPAARGDRIQRIARWTGGMAASGRLPAFLLALVSGLLAFAFLFTFDYPVSEITVEGLAVGDAREVVDASGLLGDPAFRAGLEDAAGGVAALPYVEHVEVTLTFPGEATIKITEREPALILERGGERSLVATIGGIMAAAEGDSDLPVLQIGPAEPTAEGALPEELVAVVAQIADERGADVDLRWTADEGLVIRLPAKRSAIFGDVDQAGAKLAVLAAVEDQVDADWVILDLREPTRPAFR